jgi:hypothetical protein
MAIGKVDLPSGTALKEDNSSDTVLADKHIHSVWIVARMALVAPCRDHEELPDFLIESHLLNQRIGPWCGLLEKNRRYTVLCFALSMKAGSGSKE